MKKLFCLHSYELVKNLYGYECRASGYYRSLWKCEKCGKRKGKNKTY